MPPKLDKSGSAHIRSNMSTCKGLFLLSHLAHLNPERQGLLPRVCLQCGLFGVRLGGASSDRVANLRGLLKLKSGGHVKMVHGRQLTAAVPQKWHNISKAWAAWNKI